MRACVCTYVSVCLCVCVCVCVPVHVPYKPYGTEIHQFKFPPIAVFEQIAKFSLANSVCGCVCICVYVSVSVCARACYGTNQPFEFYEICNSDLS